MDQQSTDKKYIAVVLKNYPLLIYVDNSIKILILSKFQDIMRLLCMEIYCIYGGKRNGRHQKN